MLRSAASKVMWVGRATVFLVGLAVILALVVGAATAALGATGGNFILGQPNSAGATTKLTSAVAGPALELVNNGTSAAATALRLSVPAGKAPMKVSSGAGKATNLDADKLDGRDFERAGAARLRPGRPQRPGHRSRQLQGGLGRRAYHLEHVLLRPVLHPQGGRGFGPPKQQRDRRDAALYRIRLHRALYRCGGEGLRRERLVRARRCQLRDSVYVVVDPDLE